MKLQMQNHKLVIWAAMSVLGVFLMAGCAHEVSRTTSTSVSSDGTYKSKEKTVTEGADGTITRTETKKTTAP